jgi:hypothetical protein
MYYCYPKATPRLQGAIDHDGHIRLGPDRHNRPGLRLPPKATSIVSIECTPSTCTILLTVIIFIQRTIVVL